MRGFACRAPWGCWLQGRDCAVLAGVGASSPLLLDRTLFPTSDFSPLSLKRVIDEHFSKASLTQCTQSYSKQAKAGMSGPLRSFLPKDIPFFLKHPWFALMPPESVPGMWVWHLGSPKPFLGTDFCRCFPIIHLPLSAQSQSQYSAKQLPVLQTCTFNLLVELSQVY